MFLRLQFCLLVLVAMLPQFSDSLLLSSTRKISERPPPSTTRTTLHATHQRGSGGGSTATTTGTGTASSSTTTKRHQPRRWHRRVWSKIVRRDSSVPLQMVATAAAVAGGEVEIDQETEALLDSIAMYQQKRGRSNNKNSSHRDLILSNFEAVSPHDILPKDKAVVQQPPQAQAKPQTLDEEFFDVSITSTPSQEKEELRKNGGGGTSISLPGLLAMLVENIVTGRIVKHATQTPQGLDIQVVPLDNSMGRLLTRFQFMADIYIAATDRLVFPNIRFSGGQLVAEQMTINLMGFLQSRRASGIRYPRQFDIHAHGLTMTSNDVANSSCIRNGLRQLLINILKDRGVQSSSIQITSVDILSSGKISCKGDARTHFGSAPLPFEVRTGLAFESRGHVLTFPGLEVSLARDLGLFMPVMPTIDLDVGHNAVFRGIEIDGKNKVITLDATVTITPDRTIRLMQDYVQGSEAYAARFFYDVGRWLTRLGRFTR